MKRFPVTPLKTEKSNVGTVGFTTFITRDVTHGVVVSLADQHDALSFFFHGAA